MVAKSSCPTGNFAAALWPRMRASATSRAASPATICQFSIARILTPSSPTPTAAAPRSRNTIVSANPGGLLQLRADAALHLTGHEIHHVVELLDRAQS